MIIPAVKKTYGSRTVLDMPEQTFEKGKVYAVIGANGSGKSTYAKVLAGVIKSDGGTAIGRLKIGYMPQKSYAFRMSTKANILLGNNDPARCEELMQALHIEHLASKSAKRLSGGETARMALARLLMREYDLVILDEPTAAMDMESTLYAEERFVRYCRETGCSLLLVTHSLGQARRTADYALFLDHGVPVESGPAETMLTCPTEERTRRFIQFYG